MKGIPLTPPVQAVKPNTAPERSIEIRLNSIDAAKSAVQHQAQILDTFKEGGFESIEFVLAEELATDIRAIVGGVFRVKTYYKTIGARPGNTLYVLPQFEEPAARPVKINHAVPLPTNGNVPRGTNAPEVPFIDAVAEDNTGKVSTRRGTVRA